jgi:HEAT repeat protein
VVTECNRIDFVPLSGAKTNLANLPLADVFVCLSLVVDNVEARSSTQSRHEIPHKQPYKTQPIEMAQALTTNLLLVGDPGAGKTTLLRWLAMTYAQHRQQAPDRLGALADSDRLPIFIRLGRLPKTAFKQISELDHSMEFHHFLETDSFAKALCRADPMLAKALGQGRCLLLVDGLDEIADLTVRSLVVQQLTQLTTGSLGNRAILGSRPSGIPDLMGNLAPDGFRRVVIDAFTKVDAERYFRVWCARDNTKTAAQQVAEANGIIGHLQQRPEVRKLARTPLLCSIILRVWREGGGTLPQRRVKLYEDCCRYMIQSWERKHAVDLGELAEKSWDDHINLLAPVAFTMHSRKQVTQVTIERDVVIDLLSKWLPKLNLAEEATARKDAEKYLGTLGRRSSVFQHLGGNLYTFVHPTFQEYLTAWYIAKQPEPDHRDAEDPGPSYIDLVMEHLHESSWQEVHMLTIGILESSPSDASKVSKLLRTILNVYRRPHRLLLPRNLLPLDQAKWLDVLDFLRLLQLGKYFHQYQLHQRSAWLLKREYVFVLRARLECANGVVSDDVDRLITAESSYVLRQAKFQFSLMSSWSTFSGDRSPLNLAVTWFRRRAGEAPVQDLWQALHDHDFLIQWQANEVLGQLAKTDDRAAQVLRRALTQRDFLVRSEAADMLGSLGRSDEATLQALRQSLTDPLVYEKAAKALGKLGSADEATLHALQQMLMYQDGVSRWPAIEALSQLARTDEAAVLALRQMLTAPDVKVRVDAAKALCQLGAADEATVQALREALTGPYKWERQRATEVLRQLGAADEVAVQALREALATSDVAVRRRAAEALGSFGRADEATVLVLLQMLTDPDMAVGRRAAEVLDQLVQVDGETVQILQQALTDLEMVVRVKAAETLVRLGRAEEAAVPVLRQALTDPEKSIRRHAIRAILATKLKDGATSQSVRQALTDPDEETRLIACYCLGPDARQDPALLVRVEAALNNLAFAPHYWSAIGYLGQLLDGRPIDGYEWVPLVERQARALTRKAKIFWLLVTLTFLAGALVVVWLGTSFVGQVVGAAIILLTAVAAIYQLIGRTLHPPWQRTQAPLPSWNAAHRQTPPSSRRRWIQ